MKMTLVLRYSLIFAAGFILVSLWSLWIVARPPRLVIPGTPELYRLSAEDITIETQDGLKLAAWFIPRQSTRQVSGENMDRNEEYRAIILLHGYPANKADLLPMA